MGGTMSLNGPNARRGAPSGSSTISSSGMNMNSMGGMGPTTSAMGGMNVNSMGGMGLTAPQGTMSLNGPNARRGAPSGSSTISSSGTNVSTAFAFAFDPTQMSSLGHPGPSSAAQSSSVSKK